MDMWQEEVRIAQYGPYNWCADWSKPMQGHPHNASGMDHAGISRPCPDYSHIHPWIAIMLPFRVSAHLLRCQVPLSLGQHLVSHHELPYGGRTQERGVVMGMELPVTAVLAEVTAGRGPYREGKQQ